MGDIDIVKIENRDVWNFEAKVSRCKQCERKKGNVEHLGKSRNADCVAYVMLCDYIYRTPELPNTQNICTLNLPVRDHLRSQFAQTL